ncbi:MAG: Xaa-Pro aminopeptidase [Actinomycetia bacterium]|nr:Xaa-Pro aminopeptidase [Actinomycetes bacterium]
MDVAGRAPRLRERLVETTCEALLVTRLGNIRYLTGFTGSAARLLVLPDELVFVTDGRYRDQAAEQLAAAGVEARIAVHNTEQQRLLTEAATGITRLGLEADDVTWAAQRRYGTEGFPDAELVPTGGLVESLRLVKDDGEVARIEAAAKIADDALASVRSRLGEGLTEKEFSLELNFAMLRLGADDLSFETIVGSGPNGAKPHARPTGRHIGEGDLVVLDFGALLDGYHSDISRTVMVGEPSATQRRMLEVVGASQQAGVEAVTPGVGGAEVDRVCRDVIIEAGWGDSFIHGTGHGVGLDIHEEPRVSTTSAATLAAGHVVTVEPGVYLPEHGGVRIEDTLVVTASGNRRLTNAPKDPSL